MHVLISGAGIAGLTLAYCLDRAGIACTLVEKAAGPRSGGYMIDFFGSGYDAAGRLDLLPDLERIHQPVSRLVFLREDGSEKFSVSYPVFRKLFDNRHFNFMRGDLERVLYEKVRGRVDIRFGNSVESFDQNDSGVTITLADRSRRRADVLVGADGFHSRVRSLAFGCEPALTGYLGCHTAAYVIRDPPESLRVADAFRILSVPGRQVSLYPVRGEGVAAHFVHMSEEPVSDTPAAEELRRVYGGMDWVIPLLLDRLEKTEVYFDSVSQVEIPFWSVDRVVLVGDAAWCVSLIAGQGAALAMAGAYILAEELSAAGPDPLPALKHYEQRLRPGVERIQKAGRSMADWFVPRSRLRLEVRDTITRFAGLPATGWLIKRAVAPESVFRLSP
jgi:2-polyprenyl-6-methoxyphenol hydroxylase-like FAD-dependent oxidoreductase